MQQLRGQDTVVDSSLKETTRHGTAEFPFAVYLDDFSCFKNDSICWHWHDETQITLIEEGEFVCHVDSEKRLMRPGDIIFINSGALHQIIPCRRFSGRLYSFLWQPRLLAAPDTELYRSCIEPLLCAPMPSAFFPAGSDMGIRLRAALRLMLNSAAEAGPFYQLRLCSQLSRVWLALAEHSMSLSPAPGSSARFHARELEQARVKEAMSYIKANYAEKLSLDMIARAAMTNRSELCRSFKRVLDQSPGDFLLQYRLEKALSLLEDAQLSIARIAQSCGFCSSSHFGSSFAKHMGCTPLQYRKNILP